MSTENNVFENTKLSELSCPICNYQLKTKKTMKRHMERHKENSYACEICCKIFKMKFELTVHMNSHNGIYSCEHCNKSFSTSSSLKRHMKKIVMCAETDLQFSCPDCPEVFTEKYLFTQHKTSTHEELFFKCEVCLLPLLNVRSLKRHIKVRHGTQYLENMTCKARCVTCKIFFETDNDLKKHCDEEHYGSFHCLLCTKTINAKWKLKRHVLTFHSNSDYNKFLCSTCEINFGNETELENHLLRKHTVEKKACKYCRTKIEICKMDEHIKKQHKYVCSICNKNYFKKVEYLKHMKKHSGTAKSNNSSLHPLKFDTEPNFDKHIKEHEKKKYMCECCNEFFEFEKLLNRHKSDLLCLPKTDKKKVGAKLLKCTICGQDIALTCIGKHISEHANVEFICKECKQMFDCTTNLIIHCKSEHNNLNPFKCVTCDQEYKYVNLYIDHKLYCLDKEFDGILLTCSECSTQCSSLDALKDHLTEHRIMSEVKEPTNCLEESTDSMDISSNEIDIKEEPLL